MISVGTGMRNHKGQRAPAVIPKDKRWRRLCEWAFTMGSAAPHGIRGSEPRPDKPTDPRTDPAASPCHSGDSPNPFGCLPVSHVQQCPTVLPNSPGGRNEAPQAKEIRAYLCAM